VLAVGDQPYALAAPYLLQPSEHGGSDEDELDSGFARGVYDAIGVRLRYSDAELFAETEPTEIVARIVFDMCEQMRCESLVPAALRGTQRNMEKAFRLWCRGQELTDTASGLLIFTVLQMVRSRLISPIHDELIEDQIESTRANISPIIGAALKGLRDHREDQAEFAVAARSLADAISEMVVDGGTDAEELASAAGSTILVPPEWSELDLPEGEAGTRGPEPSGEGGPEAIEDVGDYQIYNSAHDVVQRAEELYPLQRRRYLRTLLDEQIAAQAVSPFAIARRLRRLFQGVERDGWRSGEEEGVLDAARLGQVIANPMNRAVFRQERYRPTAPAVVMFLLDNSGSMKRQRHETLAVLVDTLSRALDLAGAKSEILGFTTASWNGGEPRNEWRRAGEPAGPGRLAETSHIIYKDADTSWKRSRLAVASLMRTQHFRESVDGEAIIWAYRRLMERPEPRRLLVILSDGAPTEAATRYANDGAYLERHLRDVVHFIEREGAIEIGAISVDEPVDSLFMRSVEMDLAGTLTLGEYGLLETLFGGRR
jgi:cobaltochelatase CobT